MFKFNKLIIPSAAVLAAVLAIILHNFSYVPAISSDTGIELPIVMYHSILKDSELSGKYVITPDILENDIKYLQSRGYSAVSSAQLIDYVTSSAPLPEKPVMLTFDDGCYNNFEYALPILEKYGFHGIFCTVGKYTDDYTASNEVNVTYSYMRWIDIFNMNSSNHAEIACHSYDFHKYSGGRRGSKRKSGESKEEYKRIFREDTQKYIDDCVKNAGFAPTVYAYPFGEYSKESTDVLKDLGFLMSLTCNEGVNIITKNPDCLFLLKRNNRPDNIGTAEFFDKLIH